MSKVKDIMHKKILVIKDDTSIECACKMLMEQDISGMPVSDSKNNLIGFLSERDIIKAISNGKSLKVEVKDIMVKNVFSVDEDFSTEELSKIFMEKPYRCIPVVKDKKVVGIITRKDVVSKLLGQYY